MSNDTGFENKLHDIYLIRVDSSHGTWIYSSSEYPIFRTHRDAAMKCNELNKTNAAAVFGQVYTPIRVAPVESDE